MRLNPGDVIKSIHTGNAFVVEYVSADGHCFILQPRGKENSRSYNMHDFNRSFVRLSESDTLQPGNSPEIPDRWIPVSERMPEVGVKVLCFPAKDEPIHAVFNGQLWLQDVSWSASYEPIDNVIPITVTHWMSLPSAPQEASSESQ